MADVLQLGMNGAQVVQKVNSNATDTWAELNSLSDALTTHTTNTSIHPELNDNKTTAANTWTANKISTQLAGKADTSHIHTISDVSGISNTFAPIEHTHSWEDIINMQDLLVDVSLETFDISITGHTDIAPHIYATVELPEGLHFLFSIEWEASFGNSSQQSFGMSGTSQALTFLINKPSDEWDGWVDGKCSVKISFTIKNVLNNTSLFKEKEFLDISKYTTHKITIGDLVVELKKDPDDPGSFINILKTRIADDVLDRLEK